MSKEFETAFDHICRSRNRHETWQDFITMTACAIANAVRPMESREKLYLSVIKKYTPDEQQEFAKVMGLYFKLVNDNPFQDLLGDLYMRLELGNSAAGQFFTPYSVCRMMANMEVDDALKRIENKGWISVNDCACGGGATLIAMADALHRRGCNYQQHAYFVGQDLIAGTAMMCYIQLSMLGCAGYVRIGDTLSDPDTGNMLFPPLDNENVWVTPMFFHDVWHGRRLMQRMDSICRGITPTPIKPVPQAEPEIKPPKKPTKKPRKGEQLSMF